MGSPKIYYSFWRAKMYVFWGGGGVTSAATTSPGRRPDQNRHAGRPQLSHMVLLSCASLPTMHRQHQSAPVGRFRSSSLGRHPRLVSGREWREQLRTTCQPQQVGRVKLTAQREAVSEEPACEGSEYSVCSTNVPLPEMALAEPWVAPTSRASSSTSSTRASRSWSAASRRDERASSAGSRPGTAALALALPTVATQPGEIAAAVVEADSGPLSMATHVDESDSCSDHEEDPADSEAAQLAGSRSTEIFEAPMFRSTVGAPRQSSGTVSALSLPSIAAGSSLRPTRQRNGLALATLRTPTQSLIHKSSWFNLENEPCLLASPTAPHGLGRQSRVGLAPPRFVLQHSLAT